MDYDFTSGRLGFGALRPWNLVVRNGYIAQDESTSCVAGGSLVDGLRLRP